LKRPFHGSFQGIILKHPFSSAFRSRFNENTLSMAVFSHHIKNYLTMFYDVRTVLFDLDGTVADTALDLAAAVNRQRRERGLKELPPRELGRLASSGARGLLKAGFGLTPEHADYEAYRVEFLNFYAENLTEHTQLYEGFAALVRALVASGRTWGIVTNKARRFAQPLLAELAQREKAISEAVLREHPPVCLVCGDDTPHPKPKPDPLWLAAKQAAQHPGHCLYVGDDLRDIQAAHAAGMRAVAVRYGYLGDGAPIEAWGADAIIDAPLDLLAQLSTPAGTVVAPGDQPA
jgi:N-acetyl-D-muramate 6-phosphate phosphatase